MEYKTKIEKFIKEKLKKRRNRINNNRQRIKTSRNVKLVLTAIGNIIR